MRKHALSCIALTSVLSLSPVSAHASQPPAPGQMAATAAPALAQARALAAADAFAAQAPRLSWQAKARNADTLAALLRHTSLSTRSKAVAIGKTQIGTQYRWGGTTPAGFDCSGFTRFSFAKAGKSLSRTAAAQQRATPRVAHPVPGDLVFYGKPAHHVGIYVGGGRLLHSPRTGKPVQISPITSPASYGRVR